MVSKEVWEGERNKLGVWVKGCDVIQPEEGYKLEMFTVWEITNMVEKVQTCLRNYKRVWEITTVKTGTTWIPTIEGWLRKLHAAIRPVFWSREKTCLWNISGLEKCSPQNVRAKTNFHFLVLNYEYELTIQN